MVSVNLLPLASVRLNAPPAVGMAAFATLLLSSVDMMLMPAPVTGNGATAVLAIASGVVFCRKASADTAAPTEPVAVTTSAPCVPVTPEEDIGYIGCRL